MKKSRDLLTEKEKEAMRELGNKAIEECNRAIAEMERMGLSWQDIKNIHINFWKNRLN